MLSLDDLRERLLELADEFKSGVEAAMEHRCSCGDGEEGEVGCKFCNRMIKARRKFDQEVKRVLLEVVPPS